MQQKLHIATTGQAQFGEHNGCMLLNTMHVILHDHSLGKSSCHALPDLILTTARRVARGGLLVGLFKEQKAPLAISAKHFSARSRRLMSDAGLSKLSDMNPKGICGAGTSTTAIRGLSFVHCSYHHNYPFTSSDQCHWLQHPLLFTDSMW